MNISENLRKNPLFNWLITAVRGEFTWLRKVRNWATKNATIRNYPKWIEQIEGQYFENEQGLFESKHSFLILFRLEDFDLSSFTVQFQFLQDPRNAKLEVHALLSEGAFKKLSRSLAQNILHSDHLYYWNLDDETSKHAFVEKIENTDYTLCILLEGSTLFHPKALGVIAHYFEAEPEASWVFTDVDAVTMEGERHSPWFKPDWSPELLFSVNYLKPLVIKRDQIERIDDFWITYLSGYYWPSLFNYALKNQPKIHHLPRVLFHFLSDEVDWGYLSPCVDEQEEWITQKSERGERAGFTVTRDRQDQIKMEWATKNPLVSIIIPTKNKLSLLQTCLNSLRDKTSYTKYELILVDTGSTDPDVEKYYLSIQNWERLRIFWFDEDFNYSKVNNFGAQKSQGDHLLFLNNDVEIIDPDWLEEMVRWVEQSEVGVVGAKLLYPDRSIQHVGVVVGLGGHAGHIYLGGEESEIGPFGSTNWYRNYLAVTGACMMVDRKIFDRIGGFDEGYQLIFSDIEFCLRVVEEGSRIVYTPHARLIHRVGSTRSRYSPKDDQLRAFESFLPLLASGDPYFNRNLSYSDPYPKLNFGGELSRVERVRKILE